jgi:hypothetical protein
VDDSPGIHEVAVAHRLPIGWWGPTLASPPARSLLDLTRDGVVSPETAALLWTIVARGDSLVVAAGPSGAGKTTLLTSLLDALPPERPVYVVRGIHERFARVPPGAAQLVSEISPHLPMYAWGDVVPRLLGFARSGHQVLTTMHARSVEEIVGQLAGPPLRVPTETLADFGHVALLDVRRADDAIARRVTRVVRLHVGREGTGLGWSDVEPDPNGCDAISRRAEVIRQFMAVDGAGFDSAMRRAE